MPKTVNLTPAEGDSLFSPSSPIYFGVRDNDHQVNPDTVNAFVTFSRLEFDATTADELPLSYPFVFDVFSDSLPITSTSTRANIEFTATTSVEPVLAIESLTTSKSSNTLFLHGEVTPSAPVGCEIRFAVPTVPAAGSSAYLNDTDFRGVFFGFIHWQRGTGVFLFCGDNSGTKYVRITGPADAAGIRAVDQTYNIDWSVDTHSFRILFEASGYLGHVVIVVTDRTTNEEERIFDEPISSLGTFIPTARIGSIEAASPAAGCSALIGIDQERLGEVHLHYMLLEEHGETLVSSGAIEYAQTGTAEASGCLVAARKEDVLRMKRDELTWLSDTDLLILQASATENSRLRTEEPQLETSKWLVFFRGRPDQESHPGSYNSGMGFNVSNGTDVLKFRFLNEGTSFAREGSRTFGLYVNTLGNDNQLLLENFESVDFDWRDSAACVLVAFDGTTVHASVEANVADLRHGNSFTSTTLNALADTDALARFEIGALDYGLLGSNYEGFVVLENFVFMPVADFAKDGDFSLWSSDGGSAAVVDSLLEIRPDPASFCLYSRVYDAQDYVPGETGIAVLVQAQIFDITDQFEQVNPVRIPSPALLSIDVGSGRFLQLQFVTTEDGSETFMFMGQDAQDYLEVLNPESEFGRLISSPIDLSAEHFFLVTYLPGKSIRVFVDFEEEPSINIPWLDKDAVAKADVDDLLALTTVAVGSIPTLKYGSVYNHMDVNLRSAAIGVGSGYDYAVTLAPTRSVLESKIYGARANVFIDFTDTD
jgi:hypothetical protein